MTSSQPSYTDESSASEAEESRLKDLESFIKYGSNPKGEKKTPSESDGLEALEQLAIFDSASSDDLSASSENPLNQSHGVSNYSEDLSFHRCPSDIYDTTLAMEAVSEWQPPTRYEVLEAASK